MSETLKGLKVIDVLGVFYREGARLMAADEFEGVKDLDEVLGRFIGHGIRVIAHHRPREPHEETRWGGGCCMLENTGHCHFGHHDDANNLYMFNGAGVLRAEGDRWFLDPLEGDRGAAEDAAVEVRVRFLEGHRSQVIVTSIPNLDQIEEKMKSFDPSNLENATLEELTNSLGEMRDYLAEMNNLKSDIDG